MICYTGQKIKEVRRAAKRLREQEDLKENPLVGIIVCRGDETIEKVQISYPVDMWNYIKDDPFNRLGKDVVVNVVQKNGHIYKQFVLQESGVMKMKNPTPPVPAYKTDVIIF